MHKTNFAHTIKIIKQEKSFFFLQFTHFSFTDVKKNDFSWLIIFIIRAKFFLNTLFELQNNFEKVGGQVFHKWRESLNTNNFDLQTMQMGNRNLFFAELDIEFTLTNF